MPEKRAVGLDVLWSAGASAMVVLINIVLRYLPSYGMASERSSVVRPVVLVYTAICILVTTIFNANTTGILSTMVSASVAAAIFAPQLRTLHIGQHDLDNLGATARHKNKVQV